MLKLLLKYFLIHVLTFLGGICFGHKINKINDVETLISPGQRPRIIAMSSSLTFY